jgi:Ser/Thr protein kinase RdoA (MazF antagonist)
MMHHMSKMTIRLALEPCRMSSYPHPAKTPLEDVAEIAAKHFDLIGTVGPLSSERDETFVLKSQSGESLILKIAHPDESLDFLSFQIDALLHLASADAGLPVPRAVLSPEGALLRLPFKDGSMRIVRALTFLEGTQLYRASRSKQQMHNLGSALARLDAGLSQFKTIMPKQDLLWDITNALNLVPLIKHTDPSRQAMIRTVFDAFQSLSPATLISLPQQVIHNDFNPHNILVSASDPSVVTGIIDFGDAVEAPRINDVAIALSYQIGAVDGLADSIALLKGYHAILRLEPVEMECLPTLLRTRMAMSLVISEWRSQLQPENRDYILRNHATCLAGLNAISDRTDHDLTDHFRRELGDI